MKLDIALKYGVIGGLASIIFQFIIYLIAPQVVSTNPWLFLVYVPILFCMIFGGITCREQFNNIISFNKAFINTLTIAIVAVLMVNVFTYRILMTIINPGIIELIKTHALKLVNEVADKRGLSDETVADATKKIENLTVNTLETIAWSVSLTFSILLSVIVSLFIKRGEQKTIINQE